MSASATKPPDSEVEGGKEAFGGSSQEELSAYEKLRLRNVAELQSAFRSSGIQRKVQTLSAEIVTGRNIKKAEEQVVVPTKSETNEGPTKNETDRPNTRGRPKAKATVTFKVPSAASVTNQSAQEDKENVGPGADGDKEVHSAGKDSGGDDVRSRTHGDCVGGASGRKLRPRKAICYEEEPVPNRDDYLYCDTCQEEYVDGCPFHPVTILNGKDLVAIGQSGIKKAGRGVFNNSAKPVPVGTMFGPYTGVVRNPSEYKKSAESGYAWELMDPEKKHVIGYIDPGSGPNPDSNWLAMINSANYLRDQNIIAVQYKGDIMYRVCRKIAVGAEFLTFYGDDYARSLGIDLAKYKTAVSHKEYWDEAASVSGRIFECEFCRTGFKTEEMLRLHRCKEKRLVQNQERVRNGELSHVCLECGLGFPNATQLKEHAGARHGGGKMHRCDQCEKAYGHLSHLKQHKEEIHLGVRYPCQKCCRTFSQRSNLTKHLKTVHGKEQGHVCPVCGKCFGLKGHLSQHVSAVHDRAKPHACSLCPKRFAENRNLRKHVSAVHEGLKSFKCEHCQYRSSQKTNLERHLAAVHNVGVNFRCHVCEKGFAICSELNKHLRNLHQEASLHDEECARPHVCQFCAKSFATEAGLNLHKEKVHG